MAVHSTNGNAVTKQEKDFFKAVGSRIAQARKTLGLTQQQLADHLGIAQQTLANYEAGIVRFPASTLPVLEEVLGLTPDELLGRDATPKLKRGPASKLDHQIERIRQLPRSKQRLVSEMLDAFILAQASH